MGCGAPNLKHPARAGTAIRRGISDLCWALLLSATLIYFVMFFSMLGHAENIMQQIFACADTLCWTVVSYVLVRCITSVLRKP
jgi:hypothetical protein